jgi:hypothetical protein
MALGRKDVGSRRSETSCFGFIPVGFATGAESCRSPRLYDHSVTPRLRAAPAMKVAEHGPLVIRLVNDHGVVRLPEELALDLSLLALVPGQRALATLPVEHGSVDADGARATRSRNPSTPLLFCMASSIEIGSPSSVVNP